MGIVSYPRCIQPLSVSEWWSALEIVSQRHTNLIVYVNSGALCCRCVVYPNRLVLNECWCCFVWPPCECVWVSLPYNVCVCVRAFCACRANYGSVSILTIGWILIKYSRCCVYIQNVLWPKMASQNTQPTHTHWLQYIAMTVQVYTANASSFNTHHVEYTSFVCSLMPSEIILVGKFCVSGTDDLFII